MKKVPDPLYKRLIAGSEFDGVGAKEAYTILAASDELMRLWTTGEEDPFVS